MRLVLAVLLACALVWGSPLALNPFLFDVRPDLIGVPSFRTTPVTL